MNPEEYRHKEDPQIEEALRNFRLSVRNWSEREFVRPRAIERSRWASFRAGFWQAIANPALGGTLAAAMLVASIGIPIGVHHQREIAAQHQAVVELERKQAAEQARKDAAAAAFASTSSPADDRAFLDDVDSDIAQDAPDAMQPLASLMREGAVKSSRR